MKQLFTNYFHWCENNKRRQKTENFQNFEVRKAEILTSVTVQQLFTQTSVHKLPLDKNY